MVRSQLAFRRELARPLIASYNGYKRPSSLSTHVIQTLTSEENLKGHFPGKLQGRKKASAMCAKASRKCDEGRTFKTSYDVHSVAFPCVGKCMANNPAFPNGMGEISALIDTEL